MLKKHLDHFLSYFEHPISNAAAEGLNSKIQTVKANARELRSFDGFRYSILFTAVAWIWAVGFTGIYKGPFLFSTISFHQIIKTILVLSLRS